MGLVEAEIQQERFLTWAAKLGISDSPLIESHHFETLSSCLGHSLFVSDFPEAGGRGLGAARELKKGELILRVPKSALITREALLKDKKLSFALNNYSVLSSTQTLKVCLLAEMGKGKRSSWYPYLMQLPRCYDLLESFGQYETQALQVDEAIWSAERAVSEVEEEWSEAVELLQKLDLKPQLCTLRAWLWASATVSSRTLHVPWDDAGCLCPVGDLFNYAAPGEETLDLGGIGTESNLSGSASENLNTGQFDVQRLIDAGYEDNDAAYCFYARKNYKRGEQVLLSYGMYTNLELLEHYGFVLENNPNDEVFIYLQPEILSCSSWPKASMYIGHNGQPSFSLLSVLRLWAASPSDRKSLGHLACSGAQLSPENELSVMNFILVNCRNILGKLPTSVEQDSLIIHTLEKTHASCTVAEIKEQLMDYKGEFHMFLETHSIHTGGGGDEISEIRRAIGRWKLAIQWRLRYKRILTDCICHCNEVINSLLHDALGGACGK